MSEHNPKGTNSNTPASNSPLADALWAALGTVEDPELRRPITELGMVERAQAVSEDDGGYVADVKILLTIEGCPLKTTIEQDVRKAASTVEGITRVQVEVGAMNADQRSALKSQLKPERTNPFTAPGSLTRVFAVVSGKGGVGKSSMTANLAAAFASRGLAVGIIDADVHGFSIPGLLGVHEAPTRLDDLIIPPAVDAPRERGQVRGGAPGVTSRWRGAGQCCTGRWNSSSLTCILGRSIFCCLICLRVQEILRSQCRSCCPTPSWCWFPPRSMRRLMLPSAPAP